MTAQTFEKQDQTRMTDSVVTDHGPGCCTEFQASRRRFLQGTSALLGGVALSTGTGGLFRDVAFGAGTTRNVVVVLSLRGGVDGLSLVVPHGDPGYQHARPSIHVPKDRLLVPDSRFGLHPAFKPLEGMWRNGKFAAVHAVGLPAPNRSHFAAMEIMEDADPGSSQRRGWLNRMIGLDSSRNPLEAMQVGSGSVPTSLYGPSPVVSTRALKDLKLGSSSNLALRRRRQRSLHRVWDSADGPLGRAARSAMSTAGRVQRLATNPPAPRNNARYPKGDLGDALADTARLIRADLGVETVTLDYGNWDMHVNLGRGGDGNMAEMTAELATALRAFFVDLGTLGNRVTVVTISEFGRRVHENGNDGLDHGWGNAMLLLGAGVKGGQVYGQWPGLSRADLVEGDLKVTRDYRSVLSEVLRSRFPHVDRSKVFPGFKPEAIGAMRLP